MSRDCSGSLTLRVARLLEQDSVNMLNGAKLANRFWRGSNKQSQDSETRMQQEQLHIPGMWTGIN